MKNKYPNYRIKGTEQIEEHLSKHNKEIVKNFINFVSSRGAGEKKLQQYKIYFLQFADIIEKPLDKLNREDIEEFGSLVNKSSKAIQTKNQIKMGVKRFVKWKYKNTDMLEPLKIQKILVDRSKVNKSTLLTPSELQAIFKACNNFRDQAIVTLLEESAGRPEEIRNLTWSKVNFEDKTVTLYSHKTKQSRTLPIENAITRLEVWKKNYFFPDRTDRDYIFTSQGNRKTPLSMSFFTNMIKRLGKKAGIPRVITPYIFRHTRLTELYNKKVGDLVHRKYAGHTEDSKMTAVYVAMDNKDMLDAVRETYKQVELPPEKKYELELQIDQLQKNQAITNKAMQVLIKSLTNKTGKPFAHNSSDEEELAILELSEHIGRTPKEREMWDVNRVKLKNSLK